MTHVKPQFPTPACSGTYISTTIPYVNAPPHVGFALELVQADSLARAERLFGERVHLSTGTDDHSLKNVRAAELLGKPVREWVDQNAGRFAELGQVLGAQFDDVVRTSRDSRHVATVQHLFRACSQAGDLYRRSYVGDYCIGCEAFLHPDELEHDLCREHGQRPERVEEENWFFRLSRYQGALLQAIETNRLRIVPNERRNEVVAFVRGGLSDFSVSRSAARARGFGIGIPDDPGQVVYVWVDALANYLTTFDYAAHPQDCGWHHAKRRIHVLGKGVLRFHAVYWPALLLSAGLPLPNELRVHGYLTLEGQKIGKSLGNAIDPIELAQRYGGSALRYYLLRHIPPFKDADFSREHLVAAHDAELANELGNLARRVLTLLERGVGGRVPEPGAFTERERQLCALALELEGRLRRAISDHELALALESVWQLVRATNRYLELTEPWRLVQRPSAATRLATVLATSLSALRWIAIALSPFLPELAARLAESVGVVIQPGALETVSRFEAPVGLVLPPRPLLAPRLRERAP